jgi:RHS repeat-associated protein
LTKETFTGKEQDTESNLHYFGARYYDAGAAKFLSIDPHSDSYLDLTPYHYVYNNPVNSIDPDGKDGYLLTWAPDEKRDDQVGHSAIAVQQRDESGSPTGKLIVYDLWPEGNVEKTTADASYQTEIIDEKDVAEYQNGKGREADGIIKISGDSEQDGEITAGLEFAQQEKYDAVTNNCSNYTQSGLDNTGLPTGTGAEASVNVGSLSATKKVITPVSVHNAVAESKDERVQVIKALPEDKKDPKIEVDY